MQQDFDDYRTVQQEDAQVRCRDCGEPTFHPIYGHDGNCIDLMREVEA